MEARQDARIACVGDVMLAGSVERAYRMDPARVSDRVCAPVADADAVLANFEAPISARRRGPRPGSARVAHAETLGVLGPNAILGLANNHIMDAGEAGLRDTLDALDEAGLPHAGAGSSLDEAARPRIISVREGFVLGVVAAADRRSMWAREGGAGVCPAHSEILTDSIREARTHTDNVVTSIHAGIEYCAAPSRAQLDMTEACFAAGSSLVVFHHSHCLGGARVHGGKAVVLGAGNYLFPPVHSWLPRCWFRGAAWLADLHVETGAVHRVRARPVVLDADGIPLPARGRDRGHILGHIDRWSRRSRHDRARAAAARAIGLLDLGFLWMAARGFGRTLRERGPGELVRSVGRSTRAHVGSGRSTRARSS